MKAMTSSVSCACCVRTLAPHRLFCGRSFVAAFRRWLAAGGGGGPAWPQGTPRELPPRQRSREALLNRYEAHTKNCPTCIAVRCNIWLVAVRRTGSSNSAVVS